MVGGIVFVFALRLGIAAAACDNFDIEHMDRPCSQQP
jgi:hypothetical protein